MPLADTALLDQLAHQPSVRILVFSDSHNHSEYIIKTANKNQDVELILHLGDHCASFASLADQLKQPVIGVTGNCDSTWAHHLPGILLLKLAGKNIFMAHGHQYGVKHMLSKLIDAGSSRPYNADIILFGHTHQYYEEIVTWKQRQVYLLNPGSARPNQFGWPASAALLQIDSENITSEMLLDQI